jgi:hypothetical protein
LPIAAAPGVAVVTNDRSSTESSMGQESGPSGARGQGAR